MFDVYIYDFGDDGMPGDNAWNDEYGDGVLYPHEGNNTMFFSGKGLSILLKLSFSFVNYHDPFT